MKRNTTSIVVFVFMVNFVIGERFEGMFIFVIQIVNIS